MIKKGRSLVSRKSKVESRKFKRVSIVHLPSALKENPLFLAIAGMVVLFGFGVVLWGPTKERWTDYFKEDLPPAVPYASTPDVVSGSVEQGSGEFGAFEAGESTSENYILDTTQQKPLVPKKSELLVADITLPPTVNLAVPFTPQAPTANWDLPFQEACEESSMLMVHAYYDGQKAGLIDSRDAERQINNIVIFEKALFGYYEDTTAEQTAELIRKYYAYSNVVVLPFSTVEDLKKPLSLGYPVILPAAGRLLQNPYYSGDGPPYHMLVLRGYTETGFITNDPGTRRGEGYVYPYATIMNAAHDWIGSIDTINQGSRVMIVVLPEDE